MTGQESLAKWLKGFQTDEKVLFEFLESFPEFKYDGIIFRGICAHEEIPIHDKSLCSWSSSKNVARLFASHDRYQIILKKRSSGYSIRQIFDFLIKNDIIEDCLKTCNGKYENEIIDSCIKGKYYILKSAFA